MPLWSVVYYHASSFLITYSSRLQILTFRIDLTFKLLSNYDRVIQILKSVQPYTKF